MWSVNDSVKLKAKPICVLDWRQCNHSMKMSPFFSASVVPTTDATAAAAAATTTATKTAATATTTTTWN